MATLKVARIFTNQSIVLEIFGCALHSPNKFGSALACAKICFEIFGCTRQYEHALFLDIFGCARHSPNKFGSALACTKIALACAKIREISATDQVAILLIERD